MATEDRNKGRASGNKKSSTGGRSSSGTRKSSNTGSRGTTNRSRNGSGSKKNNKGGTDTLTKVFYVLLVVTILMVIAAIISWKKDSPDDSKQVTPKPTSAASQSVTPTGEKSPTKKPEKTDTVTPDAETTKAPNQAENTSDSGSQTVTPAPTATTAPTAAPTPTHIPDPEPEVSLEQSKKVLDENFGEGYKFSLSDDHMNLNGHSYYGYYVTYQGTDEDYMALIDRETGKLYYYDGDELSTERKAKETSAENTDGSGNGGNTEKNENTGESGAKENNGTSEESDEMTEQKAVRLLSDFTSAQLNLPVALADCRVALDQWTTVIDGYTCYCLNVFDDSVLAGILYFTDDARHVYYIDEFNDFVKVK